MERKERKIVVAVDESEESRYALKWCITNLMYHSENYKLVLHYVQPPPPPPYSFFDATGHLFAGGDFVLDTEKLGSELANSVMERAEAICRKLNTTNNINMERVIGTGDAKDVICSTVQKVKADILVMGSHGYDGFFKRALLGSVSDHCARHAKCPVLIVRRT
ncbi:hypothetical protein QN277_021704 [Acacia crassicarpa]|uniref:UspA domain-containing protein n=1 Tax=Acacia crassicarpa TaxID=499986 RepID=A0AAE1JM17_9FABA|nr:hypothetical protein QN277_021704 [Acacia crassicarpa]